MKKILLAAVVALFATTAWAQTPGNWAVGPQIGVYANTGAQGAVLGIGAVGRYSFTDNWRIQPSLMGICKAGCSIDLSADVQYLFDVAPDWKVYPQAGLRANAIGGRSCGIQLGGRADFAGARRWGHPGGPAGIDQTAQYHKNPILINVGACYKF